MNTAQNCICQKSTNPLLFAKQSKPDEKDENVLFSNVLKDQRRPPTQVLTNNEARNAIQFREKKIPPIIQWKSLI